MIPPPLWGGLVSTLFSLAIAIFFIACLWKVFAKAGQPGWASIIPLYNTYILLKIVGRPGWWLLLFFIPFVNLVVVIMVMLDLAKSFGRSGAFAIGLILLSIIFLPILAFGDSTYRGPAVSQTAVAA